MVRRITCALAGISLLMALPACEIDPPAYPTSTRTSNPIATAWVSVVEGAKLILKDGCLRIDDGSNEIKPALVWPPDYKVTIKDIDVYVVSGLVPGNHKEMVLRIGDTYTFSGGITKILDEQLQKSFPPNCQGPYWVVGFEIKSEN